MLEISQKMLFVREGQGIFVLKNYENHHLAESLAFIIKMCVCARVE
jgi:hypothetical protein